MTQTLPNRPPRRSRSYLFHLLVLIPALAVGAYAFYRHTTFEAGGTVSAIKLTTRHDMVGQAADAVANVDPATPDLYLKVTLASGEIELPVRADTPIGNGLTWDLPTVQKLQDVQRVDVWDHNSMWKDRQFDRITLNDWSADGQKYHVDLLGQRNAPPPWALPTLSAAGAVALVVLLKFVWDQVV